MVNPKDSNDLTSAALLQQVELYSRNLADMQAHLAKLTTAIAGQLGSTTRPLPAPTVARSEHPLETAIQAVLSDGQAHSKTSLAESIPGANRSSIHYHCKRMRIANRIRDIAIGVNGHDVDYVIASEHCPPIPGIDTQPKAPSKGGPRKA